MCSAARLALYPDGFGQWAAWRSLHEPLLILHAAGYLRTPIAKACDKENEVTPWLPNVSKFPTVSL